MPSPAVSYGLYKVENTLQQSRSQADKSVTSKRPLRATLMSDSRTEESYSGSSEQNTREDRQLHMMQRNRAMARQLDVESQRNEFGGSKRLTTQSSSSSYSAHRQQ